MDAVIREIGAVIQLKVNYAISKEKKEEEEEEEYFYYYYFFLSI